MIILQILTTLGLVYLLVGLGIAILRTLSLEYMPWQLFGVTVLGWPSL